MNFCRDRLHSSMPYPGSGGGGGISSIPTPAPPLPPRPGQQMTRPIYSASTPYSRGGMLPYSSYTNPMYGSYNSSYNPYATNYSSGMGMYGNRMYVPPPGGEPPSFLQIAEESSAPAFQSIDSFVSAFGSISMALESTFHAVYSSFRAVVGVADHLGRVKQVLSTLAIFRFFRWMFRRIMYLIGEEINCKLELIKLFFKLTKLLKLFCFCILFRNF